VENVSEGNKRCVRKSSETHGSTRCRSRSRLIPTPSARESGLVTTVRRGRSLIFVNLDRNDLNNLHPQSLLPGMAITRRENTLAFDIVTWQWNSEKSAETRGLKRSQPDSTEPSSNGLDVEHDEPEDGLKIWGYMPGHVHFNLGRANGEVTTSTIPGGSCLTARSICRGKRVRKNPTSQTQWRVCCMQYLLDLSQV
jgi:hypothetical protein